MKILRRVLCLSVVFNITSLCVINNAAARNDAAQTASAANNPVKSVYIALNAKGKKLRTPSALARCVLDKNTGLVWELKTDDDSIHDKDNDYRWGGKGAESIGALFHDDWNNLIDGSNKEKLCGFKDWRVPTIDELKTLVVADNQPLTIDTTYFSQTLISPYWSASAYTEYPEHAQTVHFGNGTSYYYNGYRGNRLPLRLVRGKSKK